MFKTQFNLFRKIYLQSENHSGEKQNLAQIWFCSHCSALWTRSTSNYCKPTLKSNSTSNFSTATSARNFDGLIEPTKLLFNFGEWVIEQFISELSHSYIRLATLPNMINSVYNAYIANINQPPKLPACHSVPKFIIQRLGRRIVSVYCSRLTEEKKGDNYSYK